MFGLTKREQRWAAEQKAAETIVPLLTAAIEARTAMDTNDRIAALERDLTQAVQMYTDAAGERDKALADLAAAQAERDKWKAMAEWQYGVRVYPHDMTLSKGALDIYIEKWSPDATIDAARKEGEA